MGAPSFFDNVGTIVVAHPQSYKSERVATWADYQTLGGAVWRDFANLEVVRLIQLGWEALTVSEFQTILSVWNNLALGNPMTFTDIDEATHVVALDKATLRFHYTPFTGSLGGPFQTLYTATMAFRAISSSETYSVP